MIASVISWCKVYLGGKGKVTENFRWSEFACKDKNKTPVPGYYKPTDRELAAALEVLRLALGSPIRIHSAYRTDAHNRHVGGSNKSQHLRAAAADITTTSMPPPQLADLIRDMIRQGLLPQGGVGVYRNFVHYDIRGTAARWRSVSK